MKYGKRRYGAAVLGLTMLVLSLVCVVGVEAAAQPPSTLAHKTPIAFEFTNIPIDGAFDRAWTTKGNIFHGRGWDHYGDVWGDIEGTHTYDGDINLNMNTYDGAGGGIFCVTFEYAGLSGTFEGRMVFRVDGGYITGMFICHGDDDFDGMHFKGTFEGSMFVGVYSADAVIINPHA